MSIEPKQLSGKQISALRVDAFQNWVSSMSDNDYLPLIINGQLNRTDIASQCDELLTECSFDRQCLTKNRNIKSLLDNLENKLRTKGILPALTKKGKSEQEKTILDRKSIKAAQEQSRIPFLEQRIIELESELEALKCNSGRFSELSESIQELSEY
jgi:hypothetical protein